MKREWFQHSSSGTTTNGGGETPLPVHVPSPGPSTPVLFKVICSRAKSYCNRAHRAKSRRKEDAPWCESAASPRPMICTSGFLLDAILSSLSLSRLPRRLALTPIPLNAAPRESLHIVATDAST